MLHTLTSPAKFSLSELFDGTILCVNKPLEWTSHDVVNKIKITANNLKVKNAENQNLKLKIGHAGTLDPLATGLLIVCTGTQTKMTESIQAQLKVYTGTMMLGATTASYDLEHATDTFYETAHITETKMRETTKTFTGNILQRPPAHSAVKVDGKRAYKRARAGEEMTIAPKQITIHSFEVFDIAIPSASFTVVCSKGTYIRSLVNDYGAALQSGAHLTSLCRTAIGEYRLENAWSLHDLVAYINDLHPAGRKR